jgi:hypothetical protein
MRLDTVIGDIGHWQPGVFSFAPLGPISRPSE